jgi:hypothetical protein
MVSSLDQAICKMSGMMAVSALSKKGIMVWSAQSFCKAALEHPTTEFYFTFRSEDPCYRHFPRAADTSNTLHNSWSTSVCVVMALTTTTLTSEDIVRGPMQHAPFQEPTREH